MLLSLLTQSPVTFYQFTSMYIIDMPGPCAVGFISDCAGIYVYVVYIAICVLTPHNKVISENDRIWKRKGYSLIIPSLIFFIENTLRITITVFMYYHGVPFNPLHDNLSYISIFFAIFVFFIISYYLLPEFALFVLWILKSIKMKLIMSYSKIRNRPIDIPQVVEIKNSFLNSVWIIILITIALTFSIVLI